jgi:hypothetical protein
MAAHDCVIGVFGSIAEARSAITQLEREGWYRDRVSLITPGNEEDLASVGPVRTGDKMEKTAAITGATGAAVGLLAGSSLLVIPGVGPMLVAGALASAITGGLVGGLIGAMGAWGVKDDHAKRYSRALQNGKSLVVLTGRPSALADGEAILRDADAEEVVLHAETADSAHVDE